MQQNKLNKLELTWIGKFDERNPLEPRILIENQDYSYGEPETGTLPNGKPWNGNMLIHGDNLLALKALEQDYAGQVKCIYIDPPYNTGSAFEHYDDGVEHSIWLSLMRDRLEVIYNLLAKDGSLWISLDDNEQAYCKVLCDEIFGRNNFVANVIWEKKYTIANDTKWLSDNHDFIIIYAKDKDSWRPNMLQRTDEMNKAYKNPDNHPKGVWKSTPLHAKSGVDKGKKFTYTFSNGVTYTPPTGTFPRFSADTLKKLDENNEIWFGKDGKSIPSRKTFLCDLKKKRNPIENFMAFR